MRPYEQLEGLSQLVLEESYVLDVEARPGVVRFVVDFVLTDQHPDYRPPPPDETYCFRRGELVFSGVRDVAWSGQGTPPAHDASSEIDYGSIDSLRWEPSRYELEGDWGRMEITAAGVHVRLES